MAEISQTPQDELVFKPVYPSRIRMSIFLFPIGVIAFFYFTVMTAVSSILPNLIFAVIFAITVFSMPMILFREARFSDRIVLKRYFLPRRIIRFEDVVDLTPRGLVAKHGGIPLANVENRAEFEKIIRRLAAQRKIKLAKK